MSTVSERVASFLSRQKISGSLLLAVSGGVDSSVMAHAVFELRNEFKRIGVAHVNFHLRGEDSDRDQEFVRNLAQRYGFEFFTADFDTLSYARQHKLSVEIAARQLRYTWFRELAEKEGFHTLLTAHNADDNAETLLLNLVRGTGRHGLGAIRPFGKLDNGNLRVARPLLSVERSEIEAYAKENNLSFCIDRTNSQSEYSRNKVRNQVMPYLKEINPSVISTLGKDILRFRELNAEVDKLVVAKVETLLVKTEQPKGGIVEALRDKYLVFRASAERLRETESKGFYIAELLRRFGIPLNEDELESIASCLEAESSTTRTIRLDHHIATIERGELRLYGIPDNADEPLELKGPGVYSFGTFTVKVEEKDALSLGRGVSSLDADKVRFPLVCRTMQEGDKFSPFGLKGSKKVSDFLNSRKVDLLFKNILPVLTKKDGSIVCLPSLEIDDRFKVISQSKKVLIVSAQVC